MLDSGLNFRAVLISGRVRPWQLADKVDGGFQN